MSAGGKRSSKDFKVDTRGIRTSSNPSKVASFGPISRGDTLTLKHQDKTTGAWDASTPNSKVKCVVLGKDTAFRAEGAAISVVNMGVAHPPSFPATLLSVADLEELTDDELLASCTSLVAGLNFLMHNELDSIRKELDEVAYTLKLLVRIHRAMFSSDALLERLHPLGYGFTEVEKTKKSAIIDPYIPSITDAYLKELKDVKPSPQLLELCTQKKEVFLTAKTLAQEFNIYTLMYPVFNLNSIKQTEVESLLSLKFNVLAFDRSVVLKSTYEREHHMTLLLMHMFHYLDLIREFHIPEENLFRLIGTLARKYRNVPFHCFYHAFNVTQTMFYFITTCNIKKIFGDSKIEVLAMLVACLIHDTDHPGLNNMFQKKANTKLAQIHATSILENHHLNQGLCILSQPDCDILVNMGEPEQVIFYGYLQKMVMATDLAFHKHILEELEPHKQHIKNEFLKDRPQIDPTQILCVLAICMKCADLSNEIRPGDIAFLWAARVNDEFFQQTDRERALGLPVTPFMDPEKITVAAEQQNFIKGLCKPLYGALAECFPSIQACIDQMDRNLGDWEKRLKLTALKPGQAAENAKAAAITEDKSGWEEDQLRPLKQFFAIPLGLTKDKKRTKRSKQDGLKEPPSRDGPRMSADSRDTSHSETSKSKDKDAKDKDKGS